MYDKLGFDDTTLLDLDTQTFIDTATKIVLEKHGQEASILQLSFMDMPNS